MTWLGKFIRQQPGSSAIELLLLTAFILLPAALLMLSLPIWLEYRSLGDAAAREAVRSCATAPGPQAGHRRAQAIAQQMLGERGLSPEKVAVDINCRQAWLPGQEVAARVTYQVPAFHLAGITNIGTIQISRSYRETVDPYRSQ